MATHTFTQLVAPSRVERYEKVLNEIKDAAARRKVAFSWEKKAGIEEKVACPKNAVTCSIRGSYQTVAGDWVVKRVPFSVTHGELMESGMKPVAELKAKVNKITKAVEIVQIERSGLVGNKEYATYEHKVNALVNDWKPMCVHCNPLGDGIRRDNITLLAVTAPKKTIKTKQGNRTFLQGDIIQLGTSCMKKYLDIDPETLSKMYELERAKRVGKLASSQDNSGFGWNSMDTIDFLQRAVMYYGQRVKNHLGRVGLARQAAGEEAARKLYSASGEKFRMTNRYGGYGYEVKGTGVFPARKGNRVMQGRIFRFQNETYMQPYKLTEWGADNMVRAYEAAITAGVASDMAVEVPLLDSAGVQELDEKGDLIFTLVPNLDKIPQGIIFKKFDKILPYSDEVVIEANKIRKWALRLNLAIFVGRGDLVRNWKEILNYGFVGTKTSNTAAEMWREYMIATYDERREADILIEAERKKEIVNNYCKEVIPTGQWFDVSKIDYRLITEHMRNDSVYNTYKRNNYPRTVCYDRTGNLWWATQDSYDAVLEIQEERDAKVKLEEENLAFVEELKTVGGAKTIRNTQGLNREELIKLFGWTYSPQIIELLLSRNQWGGNSDEARYMLITDDEKAIYDANAPAPAVVAPTPSPAVVAPATPATPTTTTPTMSKSVKITADEGMRMKSAAQKTSEFQGSIGDIINVSGYVSVIYPFRNRKGATVQVVSDAGNVYVIFMRSPTRPEVGDYVGLEDYKITKHNQFPPNKNGTKQTIIDKKEQPFTDLTY